VTIVFRVSGEDGKTLAKSFDTTPNQEIIGEEPVRAPISDVISHLLKRGHNNARVTRFAQTYLQNFENFIRQISYYQDWQVYGDYLLELRVQQTDARLGREQLNEALYRPMVEKTANFTIPPLALYMLAVAQQDSSQEVFFRYINYTGSIIPPHYFQGFYKGAGVFGDPSFINQDAASKFINSRQKKGIFGSVTRQSLREMESARRLVNLITELRYAMTILSEHPILVDTGQYQPKYQNRTFQDAENEIATKLTNQPNFQAKVKLLSGEHSINTYNYPPFLTGGDLTERLSQIQAQTRRDFCKPRREVEQEISQRQEKLRGSTAPIDPPPTYYTPEEPPPTHF